MMPIRQTAIEQLTFAGTHKAKAAMGTPGLLAASIEGMQAKPIPQGCDHCTTC